MYNLEIGQIVYFKCKVVKLGCDCSVYVKGANCGEQNIKFTAHPNSLITDPGKGTEIRSLIEVDGRVYGSDSSDVLYEWNKKGFTGRILPNSKIQIDSLMRKGNGELYGSTIDGELYKWTGTRWIEESPVISFFGQHIKAAIKTVKKFWS